MRRFSAGIEPPDSGALRRSGARRASGDRHDERIIQASLEYTHSAELSGSVLTSIVASIKELRLTVMRVTTTTWTALAISVFMVVAEGRAVDIPTIEDFNTDVANWGDASDVALLTHVASGGPDGSGYASTEFTFAGSGGGSGGDSVVLFRGEDEFNSSGNAFVGNWLADGVRRITAQVRHNAPVPLNYFGRFSTPGNFPAISAIRFAPIPANAWTEIEFDLRPTSLQIVTFEGSTYGAIMSNVGHIQLGVSIPIALENDMMAYTFDIDNVVATPEPSALMLATGSLLGSLLCRRKRDD